VKINILHLSDLHLSESNHDQEIVINSLIKDLPNQSSSTAIDLTIFSGDLFARGNISKGISLAATSLFERICKQTGCSPENVFLCPGNHDVNVLKRDAMLYPVIDALDTRDSVNNFVTKIADRQYLIPEIAEYHAFRDSIQKRKPALSHPLVQAFEFQKDGFKIGVATFNSVSRASGKAKDYDYGRLILGERQIELGANAIATTSLKLAVMHHPLSWLAPFDNPNVHRALLRNFDALFHGHNHTSDAATVAYPSATMFISNAGCLYQSRDYFNGYSVITYDTDTSTWNVSVREFYDHRTRFDVATRFASGGQASFFVPKSQTGVDALAIPSEEYLSSIGSKLDGLILTGSVSEVAPKHLAGIFVEPTLASQSERKLGARDDKDGSSNSKKVRDLLIKDGPTLVVGRRESGRTTLLAYCCSNASNPDISPNPRFGIYVDLNSIRTLTRAALLEAMSNFSGGELARAKLIPLLNDGRALICLDNVPIRDDKTSKLVNSLINEFPKNKFVLSTTEDIEASFSKEEIPSFGTGSEIVYLHSFSRKHTRQLIQKWFGESGQAVRTRADNALASMQRLSIPRSPFLLTVLLWIQERGLSFAPVNQAALLDAFVDGLLEKIHESKHRRALDTKIKRDFLGEFALHLFRQGSHSVQKVSLEAFAVSYFAKRALPVSLLELLPELYEKGILLEIGDEVTFKFDCFRSFFLASKMEDATDLYNRAIDPATFGQLFREIDLFTGLHRDRKDMLLQYLELAKQLHEPVKLDLNPSLFDSFGADGSPLSPEKREMIESEFKHRKRSFDEQEELLDQIDHDAQQFAASRKPPQPSRSRQPRPYGRYIAALRICSIVLRNSELVDDAELKAHAYSEVMELWAEALIGAVLAVEIASDQIDSTVHPALNEISPEALKYFVKVLVPLIVLSIIRESIGTPKLEPLMENHLSSSDHFVHRLMDTFLIADLELPGYIEKMEDLVEKAGSRYQLELVFFKASSILAMKNLSESDAEALTKLVLKVFGAVANAPTKKLEDDMKQKFIAKMRALGLMQKVTKTKDL
jgi:predicted MPP superfamily phosphohydrolase